MSLKLEKLTQERKLTFCELRRGQKFIYFPSPSNDEGEWGYRATHYIFQRINQVQDIPGKRLIDASYNTMRTHDGILSFTDDDTPVIKIE